MPTLISIDSIDDTRFDDAYAALEREFGAADELESRAVLSERFAWKDQPTCDGYALRYGLTLIDRDDGVLAGIADHTVAVRVDDPAAPMVVHLSHLLVLLAFRGTGLGTQLLDAPLTAARAALKALSLARPIIIAAEAEPADEAFPLRAARLRFYAKAGFRPLDPARVAYLQPDFRPPNVIDASGGPRPLPMTLLLRCVGRENEARIAVAEVRHVIASLYHLYARTFRPQDMAAVENVLARLRGDERSIALR